MNPSIRSIFWRSTPLQLAQSPHLVGKTRAARLKKDLGVRSARDNSMVLISRMARSGRLDLLA